MYSNDVYTKWLGCSMKKNLTKLHETCPGAIKKKSLERLSCRYRYRNVVCRHIHMHTMWGLRLMEYHAISCRQLITHVAFIHEHEQNCAIENENNIKCTIFLLIACDRRRINGKFITKKCPKKQTGDCMKTWWLHAKGGNAIKEAI